MLLAQKDWQAVQWLVPSDLPLTRLSQEEINLLLPIDVKEAYPLSSLQKGILYHALKDPRSGDYIVRSAFVIEGPFNRQHLKTAWKELVNQYEILRTSFLWEPVEEPIQMVHEHLELHWEEWDWQNISDWRYALEKLFTAEGEKGFDLTQAPLMRFYLIQLTPENTLFVWVHHHLLLDGWSAAILMSKLADYYQRLGNNAPLPTQLPVRYRDYIAWLMEQSQERAKAYWSNYLEGFSEPTILLIKKIVPDHATFQLATQELLFNEVETQNLNNWTKQHGITLNTLFQGAWGLILQRYTGQNDIVFGNVVSGRASALARIQEQVGLLINTLPLRIQFKEEMNGLSYLQRIQNALSTSQQYDYASLGQIQTWAGFNVQTPLIDHLFVFENYPIETVQESENALDMREIIVREQTNYTLNVLVAPGPQISFRLLFDERFYAKTELERLMEHFKRAMEQLTKNPMHSIRDYEILTLAERQKILVEWNETAHDYPRDKTIQQLFEEQVERTPNHIAVIDEEQQLTYRELNERSNQLAHYLRSKGIEPDSLVAIACERSIEMIVGILAILKAGGAYVPLDPSYPIMRLKYILDDTGTNFLLTQSRLKEALPQTSAIIIELDHLEFLTGYPVVNPAYLAKANHLAYVIYTSGSTGQPKGVMIEQRSVLRLVINTNYIQITSSDKFAYASSPSFDATTFEIWGALLHGAAVFVVPSNVLLQAQQWAHLIRKNELTILWLTARLFDHIANEDPTAFQSLKYLIIGGEKISFDSVKKVICSGAPEYFLNGYGPTEMTTFATTFSMTNELRNREIPIGRPIANTQTYILDSSLHPVPIGVIGELFIGGDGLARGYLNQPELTKERFIENPFVIDKDRDHDRKRLYRTGDLCRYLEDGNIEYVGRIDQQVKIRGFRVEPGEIEATLLSHPSIQEAVVLAREDEADNKRLAAYYIAKPKIPLETRSLRDYLKQRLPAYMVPSFFIALEALPLTLNGKLDTKALPLPEVGEIHRAYVAPRTPTEQMLAEIWQHILHLYQVGIYDNFFELGGHSLLATQMIVRAQKILNVELPIQQLFKTPTIAELSRFLEQVDQKALIPLAPVKRPDHIPLSFAQQRLWFLDRLEPGSSFYNISMAICLEGELSVIALKRAFQALLQRHEILRTTFKEENGIAYQHISQSANFKLICVDICSFAQEEKDSRLNEKLNQFAASLFDLVQGPLWRVQLIKMGQTKHILALNMHHSISDGWSMGILMNELGILYHAALEGLKGTALQKRLPPLSIQYADYSLWQREYLKEEANEAQAQMHYWMETLQGAPDLISLPLDYPRPVIQSYQGRCIPFKISKELLDALKALSHKQGTTLFMSLLSAFYLLLYRYTGQSDLVVGTPIANRQREEIEGLIGFFVNTLALRATLHDQMNFNDLLEQVKNTTLQGYVHQDIPFERLVESLSLSRSLSHSPLFQVMFVFQNNAQQDLVLKDLNIASIPIDMTTSKFDLTLSLEETPTGIEGSVEYASDLFKVSTINRLIEHFVQLLKGVISNPEQSIQTYEILTVAEKRKILVEWNDTAHDYPRDKTIQQLFEEQVEKTPDNIAIMYEEQQLTYRELNARANQLAHYLRTQGVEPETLVAIACERSLEMIIGIMGILKAGGAYVPMDPTYPKDRLEYMLEDTKTPILLIQSWLKKQLPQTNAITIELDHLDELVKESPVTNPGQLAKPDHLAYVIYTSGSTGQPKGVMTENRGLINYILWCKNRYPRAESRGSILHSSIVFDMTVTTLFYPLTSGDYIRLISQKYDPESLLEAFKNGDVFSFIKLTPLHLKLIENHSNTALNKGFARFFIIGGEELKGDQISFWQKHKKQILLFNEYGPTETTVASAIYQIAENDYSLPSISIGKPIWNTSLYILDHSLQPIPIGVIGELYIGGEGLARGYLNRPELTKERFIENPFATDEDKRRERNLRLYRTGDLCRYLEDGNIEYVGRIDHQVKIRGFRIELGEIEACLRSHPSVQETVVLAREDEPSNQRLVAYYVTKPDTHIEVSTLHDYLKTQLPHYMIPSFFISLETMPLTPNGKLDRKALPAPEGGEIHRGYVAPRTPTEQTLVEIWQTVLHIDRISIHDNFFELGGHSLLAVQVTSKIEQLLSAMFPLYDFFMHPTIEQCATYLNSYNAKKWSPLVTFQSEGKATPIFCVHPSGGDVNGYIHLANILKNHDHPFYAFKSRGFSPQKNPHANVPEMAEYYLSEVLKIQPKGPYYLGGWSFGGLVAIEMAQQLKSLGHPIGNVILFDTRTPDLATTVDFENLPPSEISIYIVNEKAHQKASQNYQISPISFPITLFRAEKTFNPSFEDESLGWKTYVPQALHKELKIYPIMTDHYSMLEESAALIAKILFEDQKT
ncbi:MAG: amino acid adenylation domain-containing protein [Chlamydiales bacterium]